MQKRKTEKIQDIIRLLGRLYNGRGTALEFGSVFELLIATILSAQCTDNQVNKVTKTLFLRFKTPEDYAQSSLEELEEQIKPTGFYKNKAKNIKKCCIMLVEEFGSRVPGQMENLIRLPGVGRKTANIVLTYGFGKTEGIAVDTHVARISKRLGLTLEKYPEKIEKDLMQIIPKDEWKNVNNLFIWHGRDTCTARNPDCKSCIVKEFCPSAGKFDTQTRPRIYSIQRHHAKNLHYDLRLEMDGVLKSFAIPKEPPSSTGVKRLAIMTQDHELSYADFEGVIPEGRYGSGKVELWDRGTYSLEKKTPGEIVIRIAGKRLTGRYALIRMKNKLGYPKNNYLFFKL